MRRLRLWIALAITLFVLLLLLPNAVSALMNWWWFREIGFQTVFVRRLTTQGDLFLAVTLVTTAFVYLNLRVAQRGVVPHPPRHPVRRARHRPHRRGRRDAGVEPRPAGAQSHALRHGGPRLLP
jgi:uncharacterized membrane protein (UPF0182 family)